MQPTSDDADLVRQALWRPPATETAPPSDGVPELVKALAFYAAGGVALVAGAFLISWFVSLDAVVRLRVLMVLGLVCGSALVLRAMLRADGFEFVGSRGSGGHAKSTPSAFQALQAANPATRREADESKPGCGSDPLLPANRLLAGGMGRCRVGWRRSA